MTGCSEAGQAKSITLGEVVRAALPDFSQTHRLPGHHWKVLRAIAACHTPALGGHQYQCAHCGKEHFVPHSCGNRHCPSCQRLKSAAVAGAADRAPAAHPLLPRRVHSPARTEPAHPTQPSAALLPLVLQCHGHLAAVWSEQPQSHLWESPPFSIPGRRTSATITISIASSPEAACLWMARPGFPTARSGCSQSARYRLFSGPSSATDSSGSLARANSSSPVRNRASQTRWSLPAGCVELSRHKWVVYTKRPFAGPQAVLAYLCRYTHRVAITNNRFEALDLQNGTVTFRYKDYAHGSQIRSMALPLRSSCAVFVCTSCLRASSRSDIMGSLSNRDRSARIAQARALLAESPSPPKCRRRSGPDCKACGSTASDLSALRSTRSGPDPCHRPTKKSTHFGTHHEIYRTTPSICCCVAGRLPWEQPGSPTSALDTTIFRSTRLTSSGQPQSNSIAFSFPASGRVDAAHEPCSDSAGSLRHQQASDTFSSGVVADRGLSGSVQWRCIRNGSGDVQLSNHAFAAEPLRIHR